MFKRFIPVTAVLLPLLAGCATVPAPTAVAPVEVGIVALNDFHGALEAPNRTVRVSDGKGGTVAVPAGGAAWLASAVESVRARHTHTLTVAAGDLTGASQLPSSLYLDEPAVGVMNRIGLEYTALGNHEFDRGVAELQRLQNGGCARNTTRDPCAVEPVFAGARYRYLAANVIGPNGQTLFPGTALKSFESGERKVTVGVIGLPLKDVPSLVSPAGVAGYRFADEIETINRATAALKDAGADAVVVLIHQGLLTAEGTGIDGCDQPTDELGPILNGIDPRVDVVVSGHTHWAYVCNWARPGGGEPVLATSAGRDGIVVTDITLSIDPVANRVVAKRAEQVVVQSKPFRDVVNTDLVPRFEPRPEVAAYVKRYADAAAQFTTRKVGRLRGPAHEGEDGLGGPLGNLIADAQLAATRGAGAQIAFMNPFGIRANIDPAPDGTVTFGEIYRTQPFNNTLVTLTLTGAQLKALLEQQFDSQGPAQVLAGSQGFRFAYDKSRAEGDRIVEMTLDGQPIDPARDYRVTVSNFLQAGGDFFTVLTQGRDPVIGMSDIEAFEAWIDQEGGRAVPQEERATNRTPGA